ncbi:MAG: hypothetical protein IPG49_02150 [Proteobacteria bacterium]|nr:hypothetical protein [Pseudomonadota bacterium]
MSRKIEEELLLFNFRSYGRGSGRWDQPNLTPAQAQLVARTAARTPEVMVKVLSSGAGSGKAVQRHIDYIGRKGKVELLTDEGDVLTGKGSADTIPDEWNLDLQEAGAKNTLGAGEGKLHRVWSTSWCSPCRPARTRNGCCRQRRCFAGRSSP